MRPRSTARSSAAAPPDADNQHLLRRGASPVLTLIAIPAERREHQPFCDGLHGICRVELNCLRLGWQSMHERNPRDMPLPGGHRGRCRDATDALEVEVRGATRANQRNARGAPAREDRCQEELVRLPLNLLRRQRAVDGSGRRVGKPGHGLKELLTLDERKNNEICLDIGWRRRHETHCVQCRPNHRSIIR